MNIPVLCLACVEWIGFWQYGGKMSEAFFPFYGLRIPIELMVAVCTN